MAAMASPLPRTPRGAARTGRLAWMGHWTPKESFDRYVQKVGQRPRIYSFDLAGYGTLQFPEREVYALAGFSDKTLETMRFLEEDKYALIRKIESIDL